MTHPLLEYFRSVRDSLEDAGARTEALGAYYAPVRKLLRVRPAQITEVARVWRLGTLLLDTQGFVYAAGSTLRAHEPPKILGYASESARLRDELRLAAIRGGFPEGATVHYDAVPIDVAELTQQTYPISLIQGQAVVRWTRTATAEQSIALETYVAERLELLVHPPKGAN